MRLRTKKILGVSITTSPKIDILEEIEKYLGKTKNQKPKTKNKSVYPVVIFTPNPEIITYAQKDADFRQIVNSSQINLPDGTGVCWAVKRLYKKTVKKITGADFMLDLVKLVHKNRFRVGLIGGRGRVAVSALDCLKRKYPSLFGWATDGPEIKKPETQIKNSKIKREIRSNITMKQCNNATMGQLDLGISDTEMESIINKIIKKKTDILFVALGHPKQEYFVENLKSQMSNAKCDKPLVIMAVGGAFDYISGKVSRAPKWARDRGLEWLYRLVREPWRLHRQLKGAEFFLRVLFIGRAF